MSGYEWVEVAPQLDETQIYSLAVYNNKLYGGTSNHGKLYEWNGSDAWVEVAPQLGGETHIFSLAVYNDKLYGGTGLNGKLYEWNGSDAWVEVAPKLAETHIYSLAVYNDKLYGGTYPNGKLYEWNGSDAWVEVAPKLAETYILSLAVYNDKLYGGTYPNGKLYEWNSSDAWVEVAPQLGTETQIRSLAVYNNKLYGGTAEHGKLYEWNGTDAWVEVAPQLGETYIWSLAVYNDKLYGGTLYHGKLYEWNGSDAWVEVAPQLDETRIYSLAAYNNKLYGGTGEHAKLYEFRIIPHKTSIISVISGTIKDASLGGTDLSDYYFYVYNILKSLMPEQKENTVDILGIPGYRQLFKKFLPRIVTLRGYIEGTSYTNLLTRIENLSAFLYSDSDQQLILSDQADRYFNAQYLDYVEIEKKDTYALLDLRFTCNDPFAYETTADMDNQAGITTSGTTFTLANSSSYYSYPTITITFNQAQSHIYVENNGITDNRFDISKSFETDDVLEINCKDGTIKLNDSNSPAGFGDGGDGSAEWIILSTGNNEIEVGTDDETFDIDVDSEWEKVYLS